MARWLETLDTYKYELVNRPGKKHLNAVVHSVGPCMQCVGDHENKKIQTGRRSKKTDQSKIVITRSRRKQDNQASNWFSSEEQNQQKIKEGQQADPTLSVVYGGVERGEHPVGSMSYLYPLRF